jgi:hypothetical protein
VVGSAGGFFRSFSECAASKPTKFIKFYFVNKIKRVYTLVTSAANPSVSDNFFITSLHGPSPIKALPPTDQHLKITWPACDFPSIDVGPLPAAC